MMLTYFHAVACDESIEVFILLKRKGDKNKGFYFEVN